MSSTRSKVYDDVYDIDTLRSRLAQDRPNSTNQIVMPYSDIEEKDVEYSKAEISKAYIPRGDVYKAFMYDQSPIVGLAGPAGTGKSRCNLEKIHIILEGIPGTRAFVARKTRESLTESALYTYEERVLPPDHPCLGGAKRLNRSQYVYPNGSMLVVVGLDKPQRIMSTEFDIGYIQELTECDDEDMDMLITRMRNGVLGYQQLIFDVNPDSPQHWVYQWWLSHRLNMYDTYHEDNPVLWQDDSNSIDMAYDGRHGHWTRQGKEYIAKLETLTGPRYQRLRHGKWVTAEGAVYENWNPKHNITNRFDIPNHWRRVWGIDFGFTHPFVLLMFAIDDDGRLWCYKEIYMTQTLVADNARRALEIAGYRYTEGDGLIPIRDNPDPLPDSVICDWDAEGRATFEDVTGLRTEPAFKSIIDGIDATAERLRVAGDGVARLLFMRDSIDQIDTLLKEKMHPHSTIHEFTSYVWDTRNGKNKKEIPLDKDNHGMDTVRYVVTKVDGIQAKYNAKDVKRVSVKDFDVSHMISSPMYKQNEKDEFFAGRSIRQNTSRPRSHTTSERQTQTRRRKR